MSAILLLSFDDSGGISIVPVSPSPPVNLATSPSELLGLLDLAFDPVTRDLIDTDDGAWLETTDSRTAVTFQMEAELNAWWADATQGSRIRRIVAGEEPGTPFDLVDEVKSCLQPLVNEGVIADLTVSLETDESGRPAVLMAYRDLSTSHPSDLAYVPFAP